MSEYEKGLELAERVIRSKGYTEGHSVGYAEGIQAGYRAAIKDAARTAMDWPVRHGMTAAHKSAAFSISAAIRDLVERGNNNVGAEEYARTTAIEGMTAAIDRELERDSKPPR